MDRTTFLNAWLLTLLVWVLAGCAGKTTVFEVPAGSGERVVALKASSFAFDPAVIKAHQGDVLLLKVENLAGTVHNLTIKRPDGTTLQSETFAGGKTVTVTVNLTEGGIYTFHCDRPLHTTLGMSGRIEVAPRP